MGFGLPRGNRDVTEISEVAFSFRGLYFPFQDLSGISVNFMNILVTGGSGLVGRYVVEELAKHHKVGILDVQEPPNPIYKFHWVDLLNLPACLKAVAGYDAIVHGAAIPHPLDCPAEKVFTVNVVGTFNLLEAAARSGIKKFVFLSSESTLGFTFAEKPLVPDYVPIDEQHPLRPQDPYGLSKLLGEEMCRSYALRFGMQTVCLREPWIWVPEEREMETYRQLRLHAERWYKHLWCYVHVFDVARAVFLALEKPLPSNHEIFFITAEENWTSGDSRSLLSRYYPAVKSIAEDFSGSASLISCNKARRVLQYSPSFSWRDILGAE